MKQNTTLTQATHQSSYIQGKGSARPFVWASRHPFLATTILLVLLCAGYFIGALQTPFSRSNGAQHLAQPVSMSGSFSRWVAVQVFKGKGSLKTTDFTAPGYWKISWSCDPASSKNSAYDMIIHINTANNMILGDGVETRCTKNNTRSTTEIYQGGKVHLNILSEGNWIVQVQELKSYT